MGEENCYQAYEEEEEDEETLGGSSPIKPSYVTLKNGTTQVVPAMSHEEIKVDRTPDSMTIYVAVGTTEKEVEDSGLRRIQLKAWARKNYKVGFEDENILVLQCSNPKNIAKYLEENGVKTTKLQYNLFKQRFYKELCKTGFIDLRVRREIQEILKEKE